MNRLYKAQKRALQGPKKTSRLIYLFIILAGFLVVGLTIHNRSFWGGKRRFSIILDTKPLLLLSIDPISSDGVAISIPTRVYMEVPYGYGFYKAESIYQLGQLDRKRSGGSLLSDTVQQALGIPIDGYIRYASKDSVFQLTSDEDFKVFKNQFFGGGNLLSLAGNLFGRKFVDTNMNFSDTVRFFWLVSGMRSSQFKYFNLDSLDILSPFTLPDGSNVLRINGDRLDQILEGVFIDKYMAKEKISLTVKNATSEGGVAAGVARLITNIGGRVVSVSNADKKKDRCNLYGNKNYYTSYTVKRLISILNCKTIVINENNSASDLTVEIGEEYLK